MKRAEVAIIGAGVAGCTAALNVAPHRETALFDAAPVPVRRVGESLLPGARRLLSHMGLLERFEQTEPLAWHLNRSVWGGEEAAETDFLRDPEGHGWHIDRARFESMLRSAAVDRGARLVTGARLTSITRNPAGFELRFRTREGSSIMRAAFVIDASGPSSAAAVRLGARRRFDHPLHCLALYGNSEGGMGTAFTEAVEDGWWYTAPVPGGERVVAFHTDVDLAPRAQHLTRLVQRTSELKTLLAETGFRPGDRVLPRCAAGSVLDRCCDLGWAACGDAALTFDPISSRGLFTALYLGLAAAETAHRQLSGDAAAVAEYSARVAAVRESYSRGVTAVYDFERRWPEAPFWRRRQPR